MLKPLTLEDKPIFDRYARKSSETLSHYALPPIYIWREFFQFYWTIIDNRFCVFANQEGNYFMPIMPMGGIQSEIAIRKSYELMLKTNRAKGIARIENVPENLLPIFRKLGFDTLLKGSEYLYRTTSLIELKGNRYKSKRAAYNAFVRNHPKVVLAPYHPKDFSDCLTLYKLWQKERQTQSNDLIFQEMLTDSWLAHLEGLTNTKKLGLEGCVIHVDGEMKGYTFGYALNNQIFCVIFEIADLGLRGIAQYLFREFCRKQASYPFINTMDDSGLENLRRVKLSYFPTEQIRSYNAFLPFNHELRDAI